MVRYSFLRNKKKYQKCLIFNDFSSHSDTFHFCIALHVMQKCPVFGKPPINQGFLILSRLAYTVWGKWLNIAKHYENQGFFTLLQLNHFIFVLFDKYLTILYNLIYNIYFKMHLIFLYIFNYQIMIPFASC